MTYRWFKLDSFGVPVNEVYLGQQDSQEYGAVTEIRGKLNAFACNGKWKRAMTPASVNAGRIWVQKQFNVRKS